MMLRTCHCMGVMRPNRGTVTGILSSVFDSLTFPSLERASDGSLSPGDGHGGRPAVSVVAHVRLAVLEPRHEPHQLLHRLVVRLLALLRRRQLRLPKYPRLRV